jgi:uncharacterized protein YkwD
MTESEKHHPRPRRRLHHKVRDFLIPHHGNLYRPAIFYASSVMAIAIIVVAFECFYVFGAAYLARSESFLASVLPAAIVSLTNTDRQSHHVQSLTIDPLLAIAAQDKAEDMAHRGYFSHTTPEGNPPWFWLDKVGYSYSYAGENLAMDFSESADVETAWMNSPSHYANIVKPQYTRMGVGVARGTYDGRDTTFVVTFFAAPPDGPTVAVPVAKVPSSKKVAPVAAVPLPAQAKVLGAETQALAAGAVLATSPTRVTLYFFGAILSVILGSLLLSLLTKSRERYWEIAGGALILIVLIVGLMVRNARSVPNAVVTHDVSQSAAVSIFLKH